MSYFKPERFLSEFNGYQFLKKDENSNNDNNLNPNNVSSPKKEFVFGSHFSYKQICTELDKLFFHINFQKSHYRTNTEDFSQVKNGILFIM